MMYGYGPGVGPGTDWGWWPMGMFGMMGLGFLLWIIIVGLVIWFIVFLVRRYGGHAAPGGGWAGDRAEQVLRERYARGEIDRETFTNMMKDLQEHRPKW